MQVCKAPVSVLFKFQCSAAFVRYIEFLAQNTERRVGWLIQQLFATVGETLRQATSRQKPYLRNLVHFGGLKASNVARFPIQALLANQSLNWTLCGGPRLAIISFLAKPGPPQSAG